jgi:hypothetical protein
MLVKHDEDSCNLSFRILVDCHEYSEFTIQVFQIPHFYLLNNIKNSAKDAALEEAEAEKKKAEEEKKLGAFRANWKTWGATAWFITLVRNFVTLVRDFGGIRWILNILESYGFY